MDLGRLSEFSEYFRALSQSRMKETSESLIHLDHVSSSIFYNLLEFSFHNRFEFPREELDTHIQVCRLYITMFIYPCPDISRLPLQIQKCDSPQNQHTTYWSLPFWFWRSVAISLQRPSSPSACQSWQMNSAQITVCLTWVWLRISAVRSWRWLCSLTWVETCWRCLTSLSMHTMQLLTVYLHNMKSLDCNRDLLHFVCEWHTLLFCP